MEFRRKKKELSFKKKIVLGHFHHLMGFCSFILIIDKFIINIIIYLRTFQIILRWNLILTYITGSLLNVRRLVRVDDGGCNESSTNQCYE